MRSIITIHRYESPFTATLVTLKYQLVWLSFALGILSTSCQPMNYSGEIWYASRIGTQLTADEMLWDSSLISLDPNTAEAKVIVKAPIAHYISFQSFSPDLNHFAYVTTGIDKRAHLWLGGMADASYQEIAQASFDVKSVWLDTTKLVMIKREGRFESLQEGQTEIYDVQTKQSQTVHLNADLDFSCQRILGISPPERFRFYDESKVGLMHVDLLGGRLDQVPDMTYNLSEFPNFSGAGCISQTSDGKKIVFEGYPDQNNDVDELFLAMNIGNVVTRLTNLSDNYSQTRIRALAISPNGRWIVLAVFLDAPRASDLNRGEYIALYDLDKNVLEFLSNQQIRGNFVWSADSRYVSVSLVPVKGVQIEQVHVIDVGRRMIRQLTFGDGTKEVVAWR